MTRDEILAVMEKEPVLTYFGISHSGRHMKLTQAEIDAKFKEEREQLAASEAQCTLCCDWLADKQATKSINPKHSSYGYKHMVERAMKEYVSNGAFIAAAIHCGFPYRINDTPNVAFGISEKSLAREDIG